MGELLQKRVSLITTIVACVTTLLVSTGGAVAWGTSFQTKTAATVAATAQEARTSSVEKDQSAVNVKVDALRNDVGEVRDTVNRLDDKMDKVLLRLSVRR